MGKYLSKILKIKNKEAFTLIEIMIVVVIIALLIVIGLWLWKKQLLKGYDARRKADITQIKIAIEEYEKDHDCYPPPQLVTCTPGTGLQPYISKIPCDPRTGASYIYEIDSLPCPKWHRLYAYLENQDDDDIVGLIGPSGSFNYYSGSPNAPEPGVTSSDYYACKSHQCVQIAFDRTRPGPECDPNYRDPNCYGECAKSETLDCVNWK